MRPAFWLQHYGRNQLLNMLREEGYTIFNSNLYGRHWGAEKAVTYAKQLIHFVLKQEILNQKIHILADGMGALVADELLRFSRPHPFSSDAESLSRSSGTLWIRKRKQIFLQTILKRSSRKLRNNRKEAAERSYKTIKGYPSRLPVHIWQRMTGAPYPYSMHAGVYKDTQKRRLPGGYHIPLIWAPDQNLHIYL